VAPVHADEPADTRPGGLRIPDPGFAGDAGDADAGLAAAQRAYAADTARLPEVLAALHRSRVLAPVVALLGETGTNEAGLRVDKTSDIALPLLDDGSGHRAVPVFSGLDALARWDPAARPVPVEGARAAAVALDEGAEALVLDVAGPLPVVLGLPEVRALAEGRGRVAAYADAELARLLSRVLAAEPEVTAAWLAPHVGVDARLTVTVAAGADLPALGDGLARRLRALAEYAVRGLDVELVATGAPPRDALPVVPAPPG
jgi:hypothetical protein